MRRRYGIIGYPLSFTLSPKMHNRAFSHLGIDALYEAFPVAEVKEGVRLIKEIPPFRGFSDHAP
jgi:shikimate dehydrogenase